MPADTDTSVRLQPRLELIQRIRWAAITAWVCAAALQIYKDGIPFDREGLLLWIVTGLAAASLGKRAIYTVILDFLPFALVLIAYDYLRGFSEGLGMPTWWHPQVEFDRLLFFGHEPTVWLQERLKYPEPRWWDVIVALCYNSFFLLPYVTAGVLWLRSRVDFRRWSLRFVGLSFCAFALFALIPASPPWAAARCTAAQVADHPSNPACMAYSARYVPSGGILGRMDQVQPGAHQWIERISGKGWSELHLSAAETLLNKGQANVNLVAAVPSLHLGGTVLFSIFMWNRARRYWRPVLVLYPFLMTFSLVYSAEHYVADCVAGALAAVLITVIAARIESRRSRGSAAEDPDLELEAECAAIETTTSSTT
jgi:hypothetical protein